MAKMRIQTKMLLTLGLMLFVNLVFADLPGNSKREWPAQRLRFSNVSSLGKFTLYVKYNYTVVDTITRDTTCFLTEESEWGGRTPPRFESFFAIFNKISTDTIEIDSDDMEIVFSGIKNNQLQFSKNSIQSKKGTDKSLIGMSFWAMVGLVFLFMFFKKKTSNTNNIPSA